MKKNLKPNITENFGRQVMGEAKEEVLRPVLPIVDGMDITDEQKRALTDALIHLKYDDPIRTIAVLGSRMFSVLNGISRNILGPGSVGGNKGFPLLEAYQKAYLDYVEKLETNKKVWSQKSKSPSK